MEPVERLENAQTSCLINQRCLDTTVTHSTGCLLRHKPTLGTPMDQSYRPECSKSPSALSMSSAMRTVANLNTGQEHMALRILMNCNDARLAAQVQELLCLPEQRHRVVRLGIPLK